MAGIDGIYLHGIRAEFAWSEQDAADILGCTKTDIIAYEQGAPETPLPPKLAERLMKEVVWERQKRTTGTRDILENMLREMRGGPNSFSPNKILGHLQVVEQVLDEKAQWDVWPFLVEIHLTNECSHSCPNCTFGHIRRSKTLNSKSLRTNRIIELLEELAEGGTRAIFWSGGGEPLMHPRAMHVFARAARLGFQQILITNGSYLAPEYSAFLIKNFSCVRISLDAQTHNTFGKMHGFSGDDAFSQFNKVQDNIRQLVRTFEHSDTSNRHPDIDKNGIGVSLLLHEMNKDEIIGFCTMARNGLGVRFAEVKPLVHERNEQNDAMVRKLVSEKVVASLKYVREHVVRNVPPVFKVFTLEQKFLDMLSESYGKNWRKCWGHPLYPTIAADGGVYPCCLMIGKDALRYGNVNKKSFTEIWQSDERKKAVGLIEAPMCPINCKLSETNRTLQIVQSAKELYLPDYLN